jgi:hypothetical protein
MAYDVQLRRLAGHNDHVPVRSFEVAIDANDPQRLRRFWIAVLNYVELTTAAGAVDLVDPAGRGATRSGRGLDTV